MSPVPKPVLILSRRQLSDIHRQFVAANVEQDEDKLLEAGQEAFKHGMRARSKDGTPVQDVIAREQAKALSSVEGRYSTGPLTRDDLTRI